MTPKQQLLLAREEFLKLGITQKDLNIITHDWEHKCSKDSLIQCCEEWRCESCQTLHLRTAHKETIFAWGRFRQLGRLITADNASDREQQKIEREEEGLRNHKNVLLAAKEKENEKELSLRSEASLEEMERTIELLKAHLKR